MGFVSLLFSTVSLLFLNDTMQDIESPEHYQEMMHQIFKEAATLRVPMLVCISDKVRPDESLSPVPGAIGDAKTQAFVSDCRHSVGIDKRKPQKLYYL